MLSAFLQAIKPNIADEWSDEVESALVTFFTVLVDYIGEGIHDK